MLAAVSRPHDKFKNDKVAGVERGKDWSGIHHFGFQVDDLKDITDRLAAAGRATARRHQRGAGRRSRRSALHEVEVKYTAPDGVTVDVSESGWVGTSGFSARA
jgi:hypothetical protein